MVFSEISFTRGCVYSRFFVLSVSDRFIAPSGNENMAKRQIVAEKKVVVKKRTRKSRVLKKPATPTSVCALIRWATDRGCASNGKRMPPTSKKRRTGRKQATHQAPGPSYSGAMSGRGASTALSKKAKDQWISYRLLAGLSPSNRVRVGVMIGYFEKREGDFCPDGCGTKLELKNVGSPDNARSSGLSCVVGGKRF